MSHFDDCRGKNALFWRLQGQKCLILVIIGVKMSQAAAILVDVGKYEKDGQVLIISINNKC